MSAFSTWEKELHKIVFDPRYLLLTSRERKQVFEKYVKERAEEERREKRNKMRQKRDDFRSLMESANLHGKYVYMENTNHFSRQSDTSQPLGTPLYLHFLMVYFMLFSDRHFLILLKSMVKTIDSKASKKRVIVNHYSTNLYWRCDDAKRTKNCRKKKRLV